MRCLVNRTGVADVTVLTAAGLVVARYTSSGSSSSVAGCSGKQAGAASSSATERCATASLPVPEHAQGGA